MLICRFAFLSRHLNKRSKIFEISSSSNVKMLPNYHASATWQVRVRHTSLTSLLLLAVDNFFSSSIPDSDSDSKWLSNRFCPLCCSLFGTKKLYLSNQGIVLKKNSEFEIGSVTCHERNFLLFLYDITLDTFTYIHFTSHITWYWPGRKFMRL